MTTRPWVGTIGYTGIRAESHLGFYTLGAPDLPLLSQSHPPAVLCGCGECGLTGTVTRLDLVAQPDPGVWAITAEGTLTFPPDMARIPCRWSVGMSIDYPQEGMLCDFGEDPVVTMWRVSRVLVAAPSAWEGCRLDLVTKGSALERKLMGREGKV